MKTRMHANSLDAFEATDEERSERQEAVYQRLLAAGPMTDRQVMAALGFSDMNAVRPRITELVDRSWVIEIARVEDPATGKKVRLCRALPDAERSAKMAERRRQLAQDFPRHVEQLELLAV